MEIAAIIVLSVAAISFAATAIALGVRQAGLRESIVTLKSELEKSESNNRVTEEELRQYRERTKKQIDALHKNIAQFEAAVGECRDPAALRNMFTVLLQKAASGDSGSSSD